jgi:hypothetical protein
MMSGREHLMMVLRAQRTKRVQRAVVERVRAGQCLGTTRKGDECTAVAVKCGLCMNCYAALRSAIRGMDDVTEATYRQRLLTAGRLLANHEVTKLKTQSIYQRMAE